MKRIQIGEYEIPVAVIIITLVLIGGAAATYLVKYDQETQTEEAVENVVLYIEDNGTGGIRIPKGGVTQVDFQLTNNKTDNVWVYFTWDDPDTSLSRTIVDNTAQQVSDPASYGWDFYLMSGAQENFTMELTSANATDSGDVTYYVFDNDQRSGNVGDWI